MANNVTIPASPFGPRLGADYKRGTLDCVVTIAHAVALDFSDRPEHYKGVQDTTADNLTVLQANYGFQANFPDMAMRQRLMKPVFGESDGHGSGNDGSAFQTNRLPVLAAAGDFALNGQPTAFPALRDAVRSTIVPFKLRMDDQDGASLRQTEKRMTSIFDIAQSVLKDSAVDTVFGIDAPINQDWPLGLIDPAGGRDPQGAKLIENITTQLTDLPYGVISREMLVHLQRIAEKGFQSIRIIEDNDIEDPAFDIDSLITQLFAWGFELKLVGAARPLQPQPVLVLPQSQPAPMQPQPQPAPIQPQSPYLSAIPASSAAQARR